MSALALSLRSVAAHERDHKGNNELAGIIDSAADEIDRLRTALKQIVDLNIDQFDNDPCDKLAKIASDALTL